MEDHKKIGKLTMVLSVILALTFIVISQDICSANLPIVHWLMLCLKVTIIDSVIGGEYVNFYLQTKYLLLLCVVIFALGALWHWAVLSLPSKLRNIL